MTPEKWINMGTRSREDLSNSEYQRWEKRFSVPDYVFGTAPSAFLKSRLTCGIRHGACGRGRRGAQRVWLAERGLDVLSTDWSPTASESAGACQAARRRLAHR
jgi:hypothetical protein